MSESTLLSIFAIVLLSIIAVFSIIYQVDHGLLSLCASLIGGLAGYKVGTRNTG